VPLAARAVSVLSTLSKQLLVLKIKKKQSQSAAAEEDERLRIEAEEMADHAFVTCMQHTNLALDEAVCQCSHFVWAEYHLIIAVLHAFAC